MSHTWHNLSTRATKGSAVGLWLLAASLAMSGVAHADGAIAVGLPNDVAAQGVSSFIYTNASNMDEAKTEALSGCKTKTPASSASKALCKVMATFRNQCAAQAYDPKDGTPGYGWAIADNSREAGQMALSNCRDTAGADRQDQCIIPDKGVMCDGRAK